MLPAAAILVTSAVGRHRILVPLISMATSETSVRVAWSVADDDRECGDCGALALVVEAEVEERMTSRSPR